MKRGWKWVAGCILYPYLALVINLFCKLFERDRPVVPHSIPNLERCRVVR